MDYFEYFDRIELRTEERKKLVVTFWVACDQADLILPQIAGSGSRP